MLEFNNVSFAYFGQMYVLRDVSFSLDAGIHLLLGPNGSGKTTMLRLAVGLLRPQQGTVTFDGVATDLRNPSAVCRRFFFPDDFATPFATIKELVSDHACFYPGFSADTLHRNLREFGIDAGQKIRVMSLGTRHKAYLAYVLSLGCKFLLLDEPANGLDIDSRKTLSRIMARCVPEDATVLVSTHTVQDLEALYDSVTILRDSGVQLSATTARIASRLAFVASPARIEGAVYQEPDAGVFRAITENRGEETAVNFSLLYSAMGSPTASYIKNLLGDE